MGSQAETQIAQGPSDGPPDGTPPRAPRRALFLQGPPTVFWTELAAEFEAQGHAALRVNLSTADRLMWRRPGAADYRGTLSGWRAWIAAHLERERITDVLYYADRLPYHVVAAEEAERRGIPCHAADMFTHTVDPARCCASFFLPLLQQFLPIFYFHLYPSFPTLQVQYLLGLI